MSGLEISIVKMLQLVFEDGVTPGIGVVFQVLGADEVAWQVCCECHKYLETDEGHLIVVHDISGQVNVLDTHLVATVSIDGELVILEHTSSIQVVRLSSMLVVPNDQFWSTTAN